MSTHSESHSQHTSSKQFAQDNLKWALSYEWKFYELVFVLFSFSSEWENMLEWRENTFHSFFYPFDRWLFDRLPLRRRRTRCHRSLLFFCRHDEEIARAEKKENVLMAMILHRFLPCRLWRLDRGKKRERNFTSLPRLFFSSPNLFPASHKNPTMKGELSMGFDAIIRTSRLWEQLAALMFFEASTCYLAKIFDNEESQDLLESSRCVSEGW